MKVALHAKVKEQVLCPSAIRRRILRDSMKEDSTRAAPPHDLLKNITGTGQSRPGGVIIVQPVPPDRIGSGP